MITFIGLSHLSICYAASALHYGQKVLILDTNHEINLYKEKKFKIFEPNLDKILKKYSKNFKVSYQFDDAKKSDMIFLAKDIKTDKNNNILLKETESLLRKINSYDKKILVIMNQVPVGFTRKIKWNKSLLFHFVETLVFGNAINRAIKPERIIVGKKHINHKVPNRLLNFFNLYNCEIIQMTYEESELTKGFINTYLASQLITTNFLSEIAKNYQSNWNRIINAVSMDKRIGNNGYYKPGLGISGGNIERDIQTLNKITIQNKINNKLPEFFIKSNNYSRNWVNKIILEQKIKNKKISILGATYKENTLSTKNGIQIDLLNKYKSKIMMHDFKSENLIDFKNHLGMTINYKSLEHNLQKSNILIIFHNINLYKNIKFYKYKNIKCLIDPYSVVDVKNTKNIKHYKLIK
jgi:UDPglucose 6-dehydrogenase